MRTINKVLIIEDLPEKKMDIKKEIKESGIQTIHTAKCYVDAMKLLNENNYDLIILDMTLPREITEGSDLNTHYGKIILFDLLDMKKYIPCIVITRYTYFGNGVGPTFVLSSNFYLENQYFMKKKEEKIEIDCDISTYKGLHELFSHRIPFYAGMIYYNPNENNWKRNLMKLISQIKENENEYTCDGGFRRQKSSN